MSGTLPACRSRVKNDVCSCSNRRVGMDAVLHRTHCITFAGRDLSAHTHRCCKSSLATAGLCNRASLEIRVQHHSIAKLRDRNHTAPQRYTSNKSQFSWCVATAYLARVHTHFSRVHRLANESTLTWSPADKIYAIC